MIIGTAGHIDHGKTTLVKALTGVDTDRLKEEKRRGITIELGFAHLTLADGTVAGVVDVPGHERFVRAMASGAGGVDLAILVIACDEGVMPQTREHLDICRLLGVQKGVIALTKADAVTELGADWMELLRLDLQALVEGTFLEDAEVVPVSAKTGEGISDLKAALSRAARALPQRPVDGPVFLPIDRSFTLKGFGTVVTGTLLSGQLSADEAVSLLPGIDGPLRVRGLQVHGQPVDRACAGQRTAINLAGVDADAVSRGMVVTRHGELPQVQMLDVEVSLLPAAEAPLDKRAQLLLHLGTAQTACTVALLDVDALRPGESALAQLRLSTPVAALPGQRFILRGSRILPGRGATVAGGRVLALSQARRRTGASALLRPLLEGDLETRTAWLLRQAGYGGLTARDLYARAGVSPKAMDRTLQLLATRGQALLMDKERRLYLSGEVFAALVARSLALLDAFHQREPAKEGMGLEELRHRLSETLELRTFGKVTQALLESGKVEAHADTLRLEGRGKTFSANEAEARARMVQLLDGAGLSPPRIEELAQTVGLSSSRTAELLRLLAQEGEVCRVSEALYFSKDAVEGLRSRLVEHLRANQEISTQAFKDLVGQSRKFVIPLSEYFDREKVTLRVGEKRVLRRG